MKPKIYIESTIPSYITATPGRDIIQIARIEITNNWWIKSKDKYDLVISQVVLDEIAVGDKEAVKRRMNCIKDLPLLDLNEPSEHLAKEILSSNIMPEKAFRDALHISLASVHEIDFLLTWNCRHIANPFISKKLRYVVEKSGYFLPVICTPEEMTGE